MIKAILSAASATVKRNPAVTATVATLLVAFLMYLSIAIKNQLDEAERQRDYT